MKRLAAGLALALAAPLACAQMAGGVMESQANSIAAIRSGAIDGAVIGATTPAAGTFTNLTATGNASLGDAAADTHAFNAGTKNGAVVTIPTGTATGIDFYRSDANANFGGIRFRDTTNAATNGQIGWNANQLRFEGTTSVLIAAGSTDIVTVTATGTAIAGAVTSSHATGGVGYATGAGGTVTQATDKTTAVTLNKATGEITTANVVLNTATIVSFTLNSTAIAATDLIMCMHHATGTFGAYTINCRATGAGTASIAIRNNTAGNLTEAIVIKYVVIKGAAS